jgi:sugar-specific transcriptional regulator TrmB
VETTASDPRRFHALSPSTTARKLREESHRRIDSLRTGLEELAPTELRVEQRGVWSVDGEHAVVERVRTLVENADDEVVYMCVEQLLTDESLTALRDAADRGETNSLVVVLRAMLAWRLDDVARD